MDREVLVDALRDLVAVIYNRGAADGYGYEGDYEREIQKLVDVLTDKDVATRRAVTEE